MHICRITYACVGLVVYADVKCKQQTFCVSPGSMWGVPVWVCEQTWLYALSHLLFASKSSHMHPKPCIAECLDDYKHVGKLYWVALHWGSSNTWLMGCQRWEDSQKMEWVFCIKFVFEWVVLPNKWQHKHTKQCNVDWWQRISSERERKGRHSMKTWMNVCLMHNLTVYKWMAFTWDKLHCFFIQNCAVYLIYALYWY